MPWGCSKCGTDDNWDTRKACRGCGARGPDKVRKQAPWSSCWPKWKHWAPWKPEEWPKPSQDEKEPAAGAAKPGDDGQADDREQLRKDIGLISSTIESFARLGGSSATNHAATIEALNKEKADKQAKLDETYTPVEMGRRAERRAKSAAAALAQAEASWQEAKRVHQVAAAALAAAEEARNKADAEDKKAKEAWAKAKETAGAGEEEDVGEFTELAREVQRLAKAHVDNEAFKQIVEAIKFLPRPAVKPPAASEHAAAVGDRRKREDNGQEDSEKETLEWARARPKDDDEEKLAAWQASQPGFAKRPRTEEQDNMQMG